MSDVEAMLVDIGHIGHLFILNRIPVSPETRYRGVRLSVRLSHRPIAKTIITDRLNYT